MKPDLLEQALKDADDLRVFRGLEHMADRITAALETLAAERERLVEQMEEETAWDAVVDAHGGLDGFDSLADEWLAREPIRRMLNASCSVFSKWSNDELMDRFKKHLTDQMHQAFVEGCIVGSRARQALASIGERG